MSETAEFRPEGISPPAFWSALRDGDAEALALQNRGRPFASSEVLAVARRCRFGFPQAVVSAPLSRDMRPFPTLFWLTCPFLKHRCGELESLQKISELEKVFESIPGEIERYHADYAALRLSLVPRDAREKLERTNPAMLAVLAESGVGGISYAGGCAAPKCLHLQTAAWLGMGRHPASEWLAAEIGPLECASGACASFN